MTDDFDALVFKHFAVGLTPAEGETLQAKLRERPELRRRFLQESIRMGTIHEWAAEQLAAQPRTIRSRPWFRPAVVAAAAAVILAAMSAVILLRPGDAPPVVVVPPVKPVPPRVTPLPPPVEKPVVEPVAPPAPPPEEVRPRPEPKPKPKPAKVPVEAPKDPPVQPPPAPEPKPPAPPKEPVRTEVMIAVLEEVRGNAVLSSEKGDVKARTDLSIPAGASVRTAGLDSVAVLAFPDKTRVALGADTELQIVRGDGGKLLMLVRGVAALDVTPQPREQPLQIQTPQATATVMGTSFTVRTDGARFRLEVDEGRVRVDNPQGRSVVVVKDQAAEAGTGAELSVKRLPPPDLVTDLAGHWKFDETTGNQAYDASTHRHHAPVEGAVRVRGKSGLALRFDGVDDFVKLPKSAVLDSLQDGEYTIAAWFLPVEVPRNGRFTVMGKVGFHIGLYYYEDTRFEMSHYLATGPDNGQAHARSGPAPVTGEFHHVAGVVSPSKGTTQIFVNGRLEGIRRWTAGTLARDYGGRGWTIGMTRDMDTGHHVANAVIDDVRLYRRALSARDIAALAGVSPPAASRVRTD